MLPVTPATRPYLFVAKVMHAICHINGKLKQLLGGESGGSAVLFGEGRVCLQDTALSQEVQQVPERCVLNGNVEVPCECTSMSDNSECGKERVLSEYLWDGACI